MTATQPATTRLKTLAKLINDEHSAAQKLYRTAIDHALATGRLLSEAKSLMPRGEWETWVHGNFRGSPRTASRYMLLAQQLDELEEPNRPLVTDLTISRAIEFFAELKADSEVGASESKSVHVPRESIVPKPPHSASILPPKSIVPRPPLDANTCYRIDGANDDALEVWPCDKDDTKYWKVAHICGIKSSNPHVNFDTRGGKMGEIHWNHTTEHFTPKLDAEWIGVPVYLDKPWWEGDKPAWMDPEVMAPLPDGYKF